MWCPTFCGLPPPTRRAISRRVQFSQASSARVAFTSHMCAILDFLNFETRCFNLRRNCCRIYITALDYHACERSGNFAKARWHGQHGGDGQRGRTDQSANRVRCSIVCCVFFPRNRFTCHPALALCCLSLLLQKRPCHAWLDTYASESGLLSVVGRPAHAVFLPNHDSRKCCHWCVSQRALEYISDFILKHTHAHFSSCFEILGYDGALEPNSDHDHQYVRQATTRSAIFQ
jgi:hypothetical protein